MKYAFGSMSKGEREVIDGSCQLATNESLEKKKKKKGSRATTHSVPRQLFCVSRPTRRPKRVTSGKPRWNVWHRRVMKRVWSTAAASCNELDRETGWKLPMKGATSDLFSLQSRGPTFIGTAGVSVICNEDRWAKESRKWKAFEERGGWRVWRNSEVISPFPGPAGTSSRRPLPDEQRPRRWKHPWWTSEQ